MNDRKGVAHLDDSLPEEPLMNLEECKDQLMKFVRLRFGIEQQNSNDSGFLASERSYINLESISSLFNFPEIKEAYQWALFNHSQNNIFTENVFGGKLHLSESDPLPCADNYSVIFQTFPKNPSINNNITHMISLASAYILAFTKFATDLHNNFFQDTSHKTGQKLSIVQYYNFFSTARVSQKVNNEITDRQFYAENFADFIVIVYRGFMFKVRVMNKNGTQESIILPQEIVESLHWIVNWVSQQPKEDTVPLTILTTAGRQDIYEIKQQLIELGAQNDTNVKWISESLFMVTLDDSAEVQQTTFKDNMAMSTQHRQAFNYSKHIWYEKSVNLVVTSSGTCGINFEHSFSDSGPAHMMASTVYQHALKLYQSGVVHEVANEKSMKPDYVEHLFWVVDNHIQESLVIIYQKFQARLESKQAIDFAIDGIGSSKCKQLGISPDAFFQIGLAGALFKYHNRVPFNLETIDSRMFKNSRLFVVPTLTAELIEHLSCNNSDLNLKKELLKKAIMAHKSLTEHSMDKQGFYLFFSLFLLNELNLRDQPPHPFTQSTLYKRIYQFDCVSSNVGDFLGIEEVLSGFPAQDEEEMLVVGYIVKADSLFVTITSNERTKSLGILAGQLKTCLIENLQILHK